jgi:uncharacterized protein with PhoU and TrkA domain
MAALVSVIAVVLISMLINRFATIALSLTGISWALCRRGYAARDYATVLDLSGDYAVAELQVRAGDWVANQSLRELRLRDEGVVVMGIHRAGAYLGAPGPDAVIAPEDTLVLYGREARIAELDRRARDRTGDTAHTRASAEETAIERREQALEMPRRDGVSVRQDASG